MQILTSKGEVVYINISLSIFIFPSGSSPILRLLPRMVTQHGTQKQPKQSRGAEGGHTMEHYITLFLNSNSHSDLSPLSVATEEPNEL